MARITAGSAVKYIILPGLLPRIRELFFTGFGLIAFYMALVYGRTRLLAPAHPYLNQANIGKFGIIHVLGAAWKGLEFSWKNIDRILIYFCVLTGVALLFAYIVGLLFYLVAAPAMAQTYGQAFFTNYNTQNDLAFMMLDRMLGIPGIYDSKVITSGQYGPMPNSFHMGLHALFAYFSWGMFAIAVVLVLYFVVEIVLETTQTGTPFGKHFENIWVPLRLVAGIGLLIPVAYGLNSAQWITLYVAKAGSNFASNGWIAFNKAMLNPSGMSNEELLALPVTPDFTGLAKDLFTIRACKDVEEKIASARRKEAKAAAEGNTAAPSVDSENGGEIVVEGRNKADRVESYFIDDDRAFNILGSKGQQEKYWPEGYDNNFVNLYAEGLRFYKGQDIKIIFGRYREENLSQFTGGVEPLCGEVVIPNLLPLGQKIPQGNVTNADISEGMLIGASHMFAILKMVEGISKTGYGSEKDGEEYYNYMLLRAATDRYYYQNTAEGRAALQKWAADADAEYNNLKCMNDTDNNGLDDAGFLEDGDGAEDFVELGRCDGPPATEFYSGLLEKYQRYFSYGPTMGYDYFTGRGKESLQERCAAINCSTVVSGAQETCQRKSKDCQETLSGYDEYKPFSSVFYEDLGQENPFFSNRDLNSDLFKYGWGGAGIWYKFIAEKNGSLTSATNALPRVTQYPKMMMTVAAERAAVDKRVASVTCEMYNPSRGGDTPLSLPTGSSDPHQLALMYFGLCKTLHQNEAMRILDAQPPKTYNKALEIMNVLFGTKHLFSFRENSIVNPMSQLAALGRALLDKAIYNVMGATGGSAGSGILSMIGSTFGGDVGQIAGALGVAGQGISKMIVAFAMIGLTAGVLLFYVLPFMPFMYFFFAVGTWVKTIFEALVGTPLWALAHLRMDGSPGFSGKAALGGYFMLLEIFIRPIVTLFALVSSLFIFLAVAYVLNITWGIVTHNLVGYDPMAQISTNWMETSYYRPRVDQLFFTIIYIIFMYMTATSSFKLIDLIPDNTLRWISETKIFGPQDSADQQVENTTQMVAIPVHQMMSPIIKQGSDLAYQAPAGVGQMMGSMRQTAERMGRPQGGGE